MDRHNRRSSLQNAALGGQRVLNNVGRWLGVAGQEDMQRREEKFRQRKGKGYARGSDVFGHHHPASLEQRLLLLEEEEDWDALDEVDDTMTRDVKRGMEHYRRLRDDEKSLALKNRLKHDKSKRSRPSEFEKDTFVRAQLKTMKEHKPVFMEFITFIQFSVFVLAMTHSYMTNQWADFQLSPATRTCSINPTSTPPCPEGFDGSPMDGFQSSTSGNMYFGPTDKYLVALGARLNLCMRDDKELLRVARQEQYQQCGTSYPCEVDTPDVGFGCCTLANGRSGMTSQATCSNYSGSTYAARQLCSETNDFIVLRPCCSVSLDNTCQLLTLTECSYLGGVWRDDKQLCADTLCMQDTCQLEANLPPRIKSDPVKMNEPRNPDQWFRWFSSLLLHAGAIQVAVMLPIQWYLGRKVEQQAGTMRTIIIYLCSGIGGNFIGAVFSRADEIGLGSNPAVYGLIGVQFVELFQAWQIVRHRYRKLLRLVGVTVFLLLVGTLPYVDNWGHIGGFAFGVVSGIVFLPYITFGSWDLARKRLLLIICMPLLISMFVMAAIAFYQIQDTEFCSWCVYVSCIPYTPGLCDA